MGNCGLSAAQKRTNMSIKGATSINIAPCKWGSSGEHNLREKELRHVKPELSQYNENVIYEGGEDMKGRMATIRRIYEEKVGQKMQAKAAPLREGVITLNDKVTMGDLQEFGRQMEQRFPVKVLQLHIHRDEGHIDDYGQWVPNYHGHIVLDYFDYESGRTFKPTRQDMAEMQTMLAECVHMMRGESSDIKHLNAIQYKNQEQLKQKQRGAAELLQLDAEIKAKKAELAALAKTEKEFTALREIMTQNGLKMPEPTIKQKPTPLEPKFKRKI